ncbi:type I polyketide synthase [Protofrankia symbiont of Coriaria ruscifolia]|uniref:type I polyketide synthase n=1 Tax=Protofrankia symbiont of Coriaria ruscifolia TaxID=1306542 RepID=UPI001F5E90CA
MSGLFPNAHNYREYWQNIVDATDCTQDVPASRWNLEDYFDPDPTVPDMTYSRRGGFVPDVDFDPLEFGLPPNQLEVTSVMQTLSLIVARDLLRDAGATDSDWYDASRTGVVLGVTGPVPLMHPLAARLSTPVLKEVVRSCGLTESDAQAIAAKYVQAFAPWEENSFPGLLANVVAGRVANRMGLGGMNCTVDAACAASLSAVRMAVAELVDGRAEMMIAGGADTENSIFGYMCFSKTHALSKSGRIRPFDDSADGTLIGEGIGMIALKRLADAERDGNRIYAVIRGIGSSSDGRSKSIYAPRAEGQRLALARAYADADCSPASVELFEAHATGTAVGDKTELSALHEVLSEATGERHFAAIGSVKSQIGHTKGAAGTASLMKLALALHHKMLPPTINVEHPNSAIDFTGGPLYVNTRTRPWIRDPQRPVRRAATSAMGFGGTNFHVVLQEHTGDRGAVATLHRTARAYIWHAADTATLLELLRSGAAPEDTAPIPAGNARVGFVAADDETAQRLLALAVEQLAASPDAAQWSHPAGVFFRDRALADLKVGALFAGQGSQYLDMGLEAVLNIPTVAGAVDDVNESFAGADRRLGSIIYPPPVFDAELRQAQETALRRTEYAQPAIGALSVGQFRYLAELGLRCSGFLGHSFGELTALWAAGALDDADFFRLARARGEAMAPPAEDPDHDPGTMAAVQATREQVTDILRAFPGVVICNHNAPDQVVVGGDTQAVGEVVQECKQRQLGARLLPVSAAFHTSHVAHAVEKFGSAVSSALIGAPQQPVYANTAGARYGSDVEANRRALTGQLLEPVEFVQALEAIRADGCNVFVEFGPKQVLTALARRTLGESGIVAVPTDTGPLGDSDVALKQAAVQLAVLGEPITGINRHDAPALVAPESRGMAVTLNGADYVPESRRAAYRAALDDGFRVSVATVANGVGSNGSGPGGGIDVDFTDIHPASHQVSANGAVSSDPPALSTDLSAPPLAAPPVAPADVVEPPVAAQSALVCVVEPPAAPPAAAHAHGIDAGDDVVAQHVALHSRYLESQLQVAEGLVEILHQHRPGADGAWLAQAVESVKDQSLAIGQVHIRANEILSSLAEIERGGRQYTPAGSYLAPVPAALDPSAPRRPSLLEQPPRTEIAAAPSPTPASVPVSVSAAVPASPPVSVPAPAPALLSEPARVAVTPASPPAGSAASASAGVADSSGSVDAGVLRSVLLGVVAERTGYPAEMIDTGMDLEADLGVDSIKRVQILGAVQERFPGVPSVGPELLGEMRTLEHIIDFLVSAAAPATAEAPATPVPATGTPPAEQAAWHPVELVGLPAIDRIEQPYAANPVAVVVDSGNQAGEAFTAGLEGAGWTVVRVSLPASGGDWSSELAAWDGEAVERRLSEALSTAGRIDLCLTILGGSETRDHSVRQDTWDHSVRQLADAVLVAKHASVPLAAAARSDDRVAFVTVTRLDGGLGHRGGRQAAEALLGGVGGVVKTLAHEEPSIFCRALDIDPALGDDDALAVLLDEVRDAAVDTLEVGVDAARGRWTVAPGPYGSPRASTATAVAGVTTGPVPPASTVGAGDVFVVTGGARGVTASCVRALGEHSQVEFLLLGRTALTAEPDWAAGVAEGDLKRAAIAALGAGGGKPPTPRQVDAVLRDIQAQREIRSTLDALAGTGSSAAASYIQVDVGDAAAVRDALSAHRDRITGVVHGAGTLADGLVRTKTPDDVRRVFTPKLAGLRNVLDALDGAPVRHIVLFTSVAGLFGNAGQADYAAANEALCRVAASLKHEHPDRHVTAIDWGAWDGGMVAADLREVFRARGVELLAPATGARMFVEQFSPDHADDVCVLVGQSKALTDGTGPRPARAFVARRNLTGIEDTEVLQAHRIDAFPVLPATFGLGWLVNVLERAHPGLQVIESRGFEVHKGIVFDGAQGREYQVEVPLAESRDGRLTVRAGVRAAGGSGLPISHYVGTFVLAEAPPAAPTGPGRPGEAVGSGPEDGLEIYTGGTLFHGPALQGIRRILQRRDDRVVLECRLADQAVAGGAFAGALHSPVLADILLHGPSVLGRWLTGLACLPLAVGRWEYFAPLPDGNPFVVVLDDVRRAASSITVTVTASDPGGRVLQRLTDVSMIGTPDMAAKFAAAVQWWLPGEGA